MKKIKKLLSVLMATIMCISSLAVCNLSAYAAGWIDSAQEINFDMTYSERCDGIESVDQYNNYNDAFKFEISSKGTVTIHIKSEDESIFSSGYIYSSYVCIYSDKNLNEPVYNQSRDNGMGYNYNSAYDVYYEDISVSLDKGKYYLVIIYELEPNCYTSDYEISLNYKPSFSNASISSVRSRKKALKASWNKCSNVSGYQLQYSKNKNMKSAKTINLSSSSSSKTIKNLKSKKNYYVRIRTYKTVNINGSNKTYYSKWSPKKSVKTK